MNPATELEILRDACRRGTPPLPPATLRAAIKLAGDDASSDERLIEDVEADARLRYGVLTGANLTMFGGGKPITTVRRAVSQLGRRKCLSLLWLLALSDFVRPWPNGQAPARDRLWRHSLLTGVLAQQMLEAAGLASLGDGLSGGMAHDLGHLLLAGSAVRLGVVSPEEDEGLAVRDESPAPERDHSRLGSSLLTFWDAPAALVACALHHHDPSAADRAHLPLVVGVRLADLLAEHVSLDGPVRPLRLQTAPTWQQLAAFEPWRQVADLHLLAVERLPESLLIAEHLAHLLGG